MAMEWSGGGTRRKLSGALPAYPAGEANEAQIRLEAVVTPEGKVRNVRPVQKANARMEDAALREVRLWTFEPLPPGVTQKDQTCLVTFNFRLR
jgi:TonB family protein